MSKSLGISNKTIVLLRLLPHDAIKFYCGVNLVIWMMHCLCGLADCVTYSYAMGSKHQ